MKKNLTIIFTLITLASSIQASELYELLWNSILQKNTKYSSHKSCVLVDYTGIKNSQSFSSLLRNISQFDTSTLKTESAQKAFWINMYNIAAVKLVLEHYPTSSIHTPENDILWKRPVIMINQKLMTLQDIEFGKLAPLNDYRISFALSNATLSGPDLLEEAYSEDKIENQLSNQFKQFVTNEAKGVNLHKETKEAQFSILLKHLEDEEGGILGKVQPFFSESLDQYRIRYQYFNWSLNSK